MFTSLEVDTEVDVLYIIKLILIQFIFILFVFDQSHLIYGLLLEYRYMPCPSKDNLLLLVIGKNLYNFKIIVEIRNIIKVLFFNDDLLCLDLSR